MGIKTREITVEELVQKFEELETTYNDRQYSPQIFLDELVAIEKAASMRVQEARMESQKYELMDEEIRKMKGVVDEELRKQKLFQAISKQERIRAIHGYAAAEIKLFYDFCGQMLDYLTERNPNSELTAEMFKKVSDEEKLKLLGIN